MVRMYYTDFDAVFLSSYSDWEKCKRALKYSLEPLISHPFITKQMIRKLMIKKKRLKVRSSPIERWHKLTGDEIALDDSDIQILKTYVCKHILYLT
jgi:YesN/AraC family two-component response regulator